MAWVQMAKKLKINEAKAYVAKKLEVNPMDLSDQHLMYALRQKLELGSISPMAGETMGILAKRKVAALLDIPINSVRVMEEKLKP